MSSDTPRTEAGRDYNRLNELRDEIIEAVRAQDGVRGVKAFAAYDDFIEDESWNAALAAIEEAVKGEFLTDATGLDEDQSYNNALETTLERIASLRKPEQSSARRHPRRK